MSAIKFFGENQLHLLNIIAARIGRGVKTLGNIRGYSEAVTIVWKPGREYTQFIETDRSQQEIGKVNLVAFVSFRSSCKKTQDA